MEIKLKWLCLFSICLTACSGSYRKSVERSEYDISNSLIQNSEKHSQNNTADKISELVCPNKNRHSYQYVSYEYSAYDRENEVDGSVECSDRQKYCYGQDNIPMLQPKASEGWACRYVASMPHEINYLKEYMYFEDVDSFMVLDDSLHRQKRRFTQWAYMKSWVCEEKDGCVCGGKTCPINTLCVNEACYCNNEPYISGECSLRQPEFIDQDRYDIYDDDRELWDEDDHGNVYGYKNSNGVYVNKKDDILYYTSRKPVRDKMGNFVKGEYNYYCDEIKIDYPLLQHCLFLPDGRIALHFEIFNDWYLSEYISEIECKGMASSECETRYYEIINKESVETQRQRRAKDPLYQCGHETCVYGETCVDKHCVGLGTLNPLPSNDYVWSNYLPLCQDERGCQCGSAQCHLGQYCINNACFDNPFRRKVKDKWIQYGSVMTDFYAITYATHEESEDSVDREIDPLFNTLWFEVLTNKEAEACDDFAMPDHVEDYICVYDGREDGCGEAPQMYVSMAGYRCNNSNGCLCGSSIIPKYAGCRNGNVDYDALYQTLACHHEMNIYFAEDNIEIAQQVDSRGWCKCGRSIVPPNMKGYVCDFSNAMVCKLHAGCECGSVMCQFNEACIKLGECR